MSDDEAKDDEESSGFLDWFEESAGFWLGVCVFTASLAVPVGLWIATKFFGWEPPPFVTEWIEYFAA